ncbi:MAG: P1 family peptidase [Pseudomonadota bacterium]
MPDTALHNDLTDIDGVTVGHAHDTSAVTGATCVVIERPNVAAVVVGGGAPGSREHAILAADTVNDGVDAVMLSGGSAFGLDAAGGAMAELASRGLGVAVGDTHVPIVPQAIIFDLLNGGTKPVTEAPMYWYLGRDACRAAAGGPIAFGSCGGGYGATTANLKGGVGSASVRMASGVRVAALSIVNAIGSATVGDTPYFWAAPVERNGEFGGHGWPADVTVNDAPLMIKGGGAGSVDGDEPPPSTTVSVIVTNAHVTKAECQRFATMALGGLANAIRPALAPMDGDTIFFIARPEIAIGGFAGGTSVGQAACDCLSRAIARAVFNATTPSSPYSGPPAYQDKFGRP